MGGGAVMRSAAAKITGLGLIHGYRGIPSSIPLSERVVSARNSAIASQSTVGISLSRQINEEERVIKTVFDDVPTLHEAKEATMDLKEALEKLYHSCDATATAKSRHTDLSGSYHAVQAFSLLRDSPEIQNVVASLVSDRNVWEAMMKNEEVTQFYKNLNNNMNGSTFKVGDERNGMNESADFFGSSFDGFASLVQTVNVKVLEMVRKLSEFLQNILSVAEGGLSRIAGFHILSSTGPALMALTVASIMVVMVKRA
ncbi:hypothetical protein GIB67_007687 [Kingdonia uniflora]|uniref:Uncharacterized protein n=1 Tax=Kingdonia uniflora TaxID=39325 RepID=A0A7J7N1N1_9MAGN|nr:hypothetical protein GIB67_007687 [Kingdonia uniflora]